MCLNIKTFLIGTVILNKIVQMEVMKKIVVSRINNLFNSNLTFIHSSKTIIFRLSQKTKSVPMTSSNVIPREIVYQYHMFVMAIRYFQIRISTCQYDVKHAFLKKFRIANQMVKMKILLGVAQVLTWIHFYARQICSAVRVVYVSVNHLRVMEKLIVKEVC